MSSHVRVISQHPLGKRCSLYAGYAEVLAAHLDTRTEVVVTTERDFDAHGRASQPGTDPDPEKETGRPSD